MSATRVATLIAYALALALIGVLEIVGRREGSRVPTLAQICGFVMRYRVGRIPLGRVALLGFWWWVGFHFFAR
ncbi:DUF6186 family protein [Actinocatenispora rupis]|uniref:Uncharacterized protein n=1 Tax=Actinocatenispora rupis TaxID=519421 RepID=A0A8J3J2X1_9ACTN|nr:DUF6186 family protein [Actinocatenispora rupis]GID09189.1 hypothetical protein Aru02nite_00780 [Actinocatenispora rupis]